MAAKVRVPLSQLRLGTVCRQHIESDDGILLISANTRITKQIIHGLRERDIKFVEVDPRDLRGGRKTVKRKVDTTFSPDGIWPASHPLKNILVNRFESGFDEEHAKRLRTRFDLSKQRFGMLQYRIHRNRLDSVTEIRNLTIDYAREMLRDHDQTLCVFSDLDAEHPWMIQSTRLSVIAMAIAIDQQLDGPQTTEIGLAGMLHCAGLIAMGAIAGRGEAMSRQAMSADQIWDFQKHPVAASRIIGQAADAPHGIQMAVQQIHEQYDGSGFPRGIRAHRIHRYARILNVAEAYVRLTSKSVDHPALVAHDALGLMLHQAAKGVFEPKSVKSLLATQTLFPLGSFVELDDGNRYQVARRPLRGYAEPVVINEDGKRIDTATHSLRIVRPVAAQDGQETRIPPSRMSQHRWDPIMGLDPIVGLGSSNQHRGAA